ncbi:MAG: hypothetical protein ACFFDN_41515, partial [Candidatus Hodarchaeota archaeon]
MMIKFLTYQFIIYLSLCQIFIISETPYAQEITTKNRTFEQIKNSVLILDDGQKKSYGIYLANTRDNKFMYVLSSNQLNIGSDNTIQGNLISGKIKKLKVAEVFNNDTLRVAVYKIKSPLKK